MKTILELGIGDKIYLYDLAIKELVIGQITHLTRTDFSNVILEFQTILGPEGYPLTDIVKFNQNRVRGSALVLTHYLYRFVFISTSLDLILESILNENVR